MTKFGAENEVSTDSDVADVVEEFMVVGAVLTASDGANDEKAGPDNNERGERGIFVSEIFVETCGEVILVAGFEVVAATAFSNLNAVLFTKFDGAGDEKEFKIVDAVVFCVVIFILSGLDVGK